jgi:predicted amidohydrolase
MANTMMIAAVQMDVAFGESARNTDAMIARLEEAAGHGAALVVFPECALSGYCFESLEEARMCAEPVPGPHSARIAEACSRCGTRAVFGLLEADGDLIFNACALVGPQGVEAVYRKVHLPRLGVDCFTTPGDCPFAVCDAGPARIGMSICYDGAFPEATRIMALEGADLVVLPTNWPPGTENTAAYVPNTRALENNIYYLAVNRVGIERGFRFIGHSKICGPDGSVLDEAPHENEAILYAEIDLDRARQKRLVRVPGRHEIHRFADRRPEFYGALVDPGLVPPREA